MRLVVQLETGDKHFFKAEGSRAIITKLKDVIERIENGEREFVIPSSSKYTKTEVSYVTDNDEIQLSLHLEDILDRVPTLDQEEGRQVLKHIRETQVSPIEVYFPVIDEAVVTLFKDK